MRTLRVVSSGLLCLALALFLATPAFADSFTLFSSGLTTPETISLAPSGFGSFAGTYLVPDFASDVATIWSIPVSGGTPSVFAPFNSVDPNQSFAFTGGVFLPASWGANAGKYFAAGDDGNGQAIANIYNSDGSFTAFVRLPSGEFSNPAIAPAAFGAFGGDVIVGLGNQIVAIDPAGLVTVIATDPRIGGMNSVLAQTCLQPFGLAFAPSGWGASAGDLLVSNACDGSVVAVSADGSVSDFSTVPTDPLAESNSFGFAGARQITFSPAGFLSGSAQPLAFISVSGSQTGGGTLGNIFAVNEAGQIVAGLRADLGLVAFDPRGMYFLGDGTALIADASDPIVVATADAFQAIATPEPATMLTTVTGLIAIGWRRRRLSAVRQRDRR
jgi:hypothetical protein